MKGIKEIKEIYRENVNGAVKKIIQRRKKITTTIRPYENEPTCHKGRFSVQKTPEFYYNWPSKETVNRCLVFESKIKLSDVPLTSHCLQKDSLF